MGRNSFTRWLYYDPTSADEAAHHESVLKKIDAWWQAFEANTARLADLFHQRTQWNLPNWMERHLQTIHPHLMWEFGPALKGKGHRLVITPESARYLRPLTDTILARAPRIKGWQFLGYRPAEDLQNAHMTVEARTGGFISDVSFQARLGEHNLVDLTFCSPRTQHQSDEQAGHDAFVATETLLGEERLEKWIGLIDVAPLPKDPTKSGVLSLDKLADRVNALVNQTLDQLLARPFLELVDGVEWTLFEVQPEAREDYHAQTDMFLGKSANQKLWMATHSGVAFFSERFSKCGETFCYIKVDGSQGLAEEGFADKAEIEDALDEVLVPQGLGCHVGGGTGQRYSYIDLALTDVHRAIPAIQRRLRQGRVPRRCWILFFDDYLAGEWVGIYDDTPAPPMAEFE